MVLTMVAHSIFVSSAVASSRTLSMAPPCADVHVPKPMEARSPRRTAPISVPQGCWSCLGWSKRLQQVSAAVQKPINASGSRDGGGSSGSLCRRMTWTSHHSGSPQHRERCVQRSRMRLAGGSEPCAHRQVACHRDEAACGGTAEAAHHPEHPQIEAGLCSRVARCPSAGRKQLVRAVRARHMLLERFAASDAGQREQ